MLKIVNRRGGGGIKYCINAKNRRETYRMINYVPRVNKFHYMDEVCVRNFMYFSKNPFVCVHFLCGISEFYMCLGPGVYWGIRSLFSKKKLS